MCVRECDSFFVFLIFFNFQFRPPPDSRSRVVGSAREKKSNYNSIDVQNQIALHKIPNEKSFATRKKKEFC